MDEYQYKNGGPVWVGDNPKHMALICCNHGILTENGVMWVVEFIGGVKQLIWSKDLCSTLKERT